MTLVVPPVTDLLRRSRTGDGTAGAQPMFPTIIAIRNDRVVAAVITPRMAATLSCAQTLAVGLAAEALVLAAEAQLDGTPALTYSVMTRERQAKYVLQEITGEGAATRFSVPVDGGDPANGGILAALAGGLSQRPMDVTQVARKGSDTSGTFGDAPFLPPEQGRVVVDAGTIRTLQERVQGIGGRALYVARSAEAGQLALQAGTPRACLVNTLA